MTLKMRERFAFQICFFFSICYLNGALDIKGVHIDVISKYTPDSAGNFHCLDNSEVIPFNFINDDYCDCEDGSDEPGTSACQNALFYCENAGYIPSSILSNRVNDNICDCCDGSDEYSSSITCPNQCLDLGRQAQEEHERQQELFEQGFALYKEYANKGKEIKANNKIKLEELKKFEIEEEAIKSEKEALKNIAEEKEKAALSHFKAAKEEEQKREEEIEMVKHQAEEKKKAEIAFHELDLDHNNILTYQEIQQFQKFDSNEDGKVSEEEAKFFLHMKDDITLDEFVTTGWMIMKPIYELDQVILDHTQTSSIQSQEKVEKETVEQSFESKKEESDEELFPHEDDSLLEDDTLVDEEDDELDEDITERPVFAPKEKDHTTSSKPEYDEETQYLVDVANEARKEYNDACSKVEKIKQEIGQLQTDINSDFGPEEEFGSLKGQCFDLEDREYTYRLCPFDRANQISKSGASDVILGRWGSWAGSTVKYSSMKFDNGQTCWNGPARSVKVLMECGLENKLISSSEPDRCEYVFEFRTPALCSVPSTEKTVHQHTEL